LILSASSALAIAVNSTTIGRTCGSALSSSQVQAFEADFQAALAKKPYQATDVTAQSCSIPIYWHVISAGSGES